MKYADMKMENCHFYSNSHKKLIDRIGSDSNKALDVVKHIAQEPMPEFGLAELELFEISPWPLVISKQWENRFDDFIQGITPLLWKSLLLYFGDDSEKFSDHTGLPILLHTILKESKLDPYNLFARHDVIISDNEIKLLEVNAGSAIGGWELSLIEKRMAETLHQMTGLDSNSVSAISIFGKLFNCLATQIKSLATRHHSGNILFVFEDLPPQSIEGLINNQLQTYYESSADYQQGRVIITDREGDIRFGLDGEVRFDGEVINGMLKAGARYGVQLTNAEVNGHLAYPDSLVYKVLGQKSMLALAHKPHVKSQLSVSERNFVDKHIPFTTTLDEAEVLYGNEMHTLEELLINKRSEFVIKKSNSLAGMDVFVGCFTDIDVWQEMVEMLIGNAHWVAQAYCESDKFLHASESCKIEQFTPVWGLFSFENSYCGAFVRANSGSSGSDDGVINSATGALEFTVLEENNIEPLDLDNLLEEVTLEQSNPSAKQNSFMLSASYGKLVNMLTEEKHYLASIVNELPTRQFPEFAQRGLTSYPLSRWPLLIGEKTMEKFEHFVENYELLLRHVVNYCFVQNLDVWKGYLGHGMFLLSLFSEQNINYDNLLIRHDTHVSNGKIKMLEANVGCSIGGWEIDLYQDSTLDAVEQLMPINRKEYSVRPFLQNLFAHFSSAISRLGLDTISGNVLFISKPMDKSLERLFNDQLQELYQSQSTYVGGQVIFGTEPELIALQDNLSLCYQDQPFEALVMPDLSAYPQLAIDVTRSVMAGKVISADSPMFEILGNKAMMALFHEPTVLNSLDKPLKDFVKESVPYTVKMSKASGVLAGVELTLRQMLLSHQEQFVLKKTDSSHGIDVYVGRFCAEVKWQELVDLHLGSTSWIAQEYCEPDHIIAADNLSIVSEFLPVWGLFSVGAKYAGAQVRAEDKNNRQGVVNTHQGASVFAVLEVKNENEIVNDDEQFAKKQAINACYSEAFENMCAFYAQEATHTGHVLPFTLEGLPKFMGFHEELHYLPLILSKKLVNEFEEFIQGYPEVVLRAMHSMVKDAEAFKELLNESSLLFDVITEHAPDPAELMFRYDIHCDGQQLHMLEANLGTVIGGWEADWLEDRVRSRISDFESQSDVDHFYREVTPQMFRALIDNILEIKGGQSTGLVLIGTEAERSEEWISFENGLEGVFKSVKNGGYDHGKISFFHCWQELDFSSEGKVQFNGVEVDTVFATTPTLENKKPGMLNARLMSAYLAGNLIFPDSPLHQIFGNKLVMPLLHDYVGSRLASDEDISFIERFIPWSARLNGLFQSQNAEKLNQVKQTPEKYVLKKSASSKGSDVIVGKYCTVSQWLAAIDKVRLEDDWLIQEYCPASKVYLPDEGKLIANDMVLAVYGLRNQYCGAWARLVRECNTGVINVGTGAVPMLVLEELDKQQVVTI